MKNIFFLLVLLKITSTLSQLNPSLPNVLYEEGDIRFKKNLLKIERYEYKTQMGFSELDSTSQKEFLKEKRLLIFDHSGNLVLFKKTDYDYRWSNSSKTFKYDENKRLVELINGNRSPESKFVFNYSDDSENITRTIYEYDRRKKEYNVKYQSYTEFEIVDNRLLSSKGVGEYGRVSKSIYKYDDKGNIIYGEFGAVTENTKYKYDQNGNIVYQHTKNNHNKGGYSKSKFDKNNLIEKVSYDLDGSLRWKEVFKYEGNILIHESRLSYFDNKISSKTEVKYKVDQKGNWIEKETIRDEVPFELITRKITCRD